MLNVIHLRFIKPHLVAWILDMLHILSETKLKTDIGSKLTLFFPETLAPPSAFHYFFLHFIFNLGPPLLPFLPRQGGCILLLQPSWEIPITYSRRLQEKTNRAVWSSGAGCLNPEETAGHPMMCGAGPSVAVVQRDIAGQRCIRWAGKCVNRGPHCIMGNKTKGAKFLLNIL